MKISQFADKFQVSNDTIRYYMELKLVIPEKKGGHYYFDQKCKQQMTEVINLKNMGFSLQEIKNILNYQKISRLTDYQKNHYYRSIFKKKLTSIEGEIKQLNKARNSLTAKLAEMETEKSRDFSQSGIPLSTLSLFACPGCEQELLLEAEKVRANQVINGSLNCRCGISLQIKDGILYTNNIKENHEDINEDFFDDYLQDTDADYLDKIIYGLDWMQRQLNQTDLQNKVILEPGSGFGFLLRQLYQKLPASSVYICVDKRADVNTLLKEILETIKAETTVIFITADLPELPLKKHSIDILVDYTGTSNYSFQKPGFLLELLDKYLKKELRLFSSYLIYQKFGSESIIPAEFRDCYKLGFIKGKLSSLGYEIKKEQELGTVADKAPGKYENFARSGDVVKGYQLVAERWG